MQILNRIWQIALRKNHSDYKLINNPSHSWVADPFVIQDDGKIYIFVELTNKLTQKGVIAYTEYEEDKELKWNTVIEENTHLSFPNVYKKNGEWYMIPESAHSGSISIYKARLFPKTWEICYIQKTEDRYVDSVFALFGNNTILISYNLSSQSLDFFEYREKENQFVRIYSIVDDKKCLRPAGKIIYRNGKVVLPTQNCEDEYGKEVFFGELSRNENTFEYRRTQDKLTGELCLGKLRKWCGCHTYNITEEYSIIDVKYKAIDPIAYIGRIYNKLRK